MKKKLPEPVNGGGLDDWEMDLAGHTKETLKAGKARGGITKEFYTAILKQPPRFKPGDLVYGHLLHGADRDILVVDSVLAQNLGFFAYCLAAHPIGDKKGTPEWEWVDEIDVQKVTKKLLDRLQKEADRQQKQVRLAREKNGRDRK